MIPAWAGCEYLVADSKSPEIKKVGHCLPDVIGGQTAGQDHLFVEALLIQLTGAYVNSSMFILPVILHRGGLYLRTIKRAMPGLFLQKS